MLLAALRHDLLAWIREDDVVRESLARSGSLWRGYHPEMEAVHRRNAERLAAAVAAHGWPGRSLVLVDGATAAFRIAQHAIGEPARMRAWLPLIVAAAELGEADPKEAAMLDDRVRVFSGRPQRFGTQLDWSAAGDAMVPMGEIEAPESLDERRRAVGLGPMEWVRPPPPGETAPVDMAERRREAEAWARRVGWR